MNLRTLFAIPITIILVVTLSLAGMVAGQGWSGLIRGRAAIVAVERMQLLLTLQTDLRTERIVSNFVLGQPSPLGKQARLRLEDTRQQTDRAARAVLAEFLAEGTANPEQYLAAIVPKLHAARATVDRLLAVGVTERQLAELDTVMPQLLAVSQLVDGPLAHADLAVTQADESLSGLLVEDRLAEAVRDQVGLIAAVLLPRFNKSEQPTAEELDRVRILLARAAYLTQFLSRTIEISGATDRIATALADLNTIDVTGILGRLESQAGDRPDETGTVLPQRLLVPWGERVNLLREAIVDATVQHVITRQAAREMQFDLVITGFGAVMLAVMESVVLLSQRVVGPLAQLGSAITRIAAGDRSTKLTLHSGTREINEMVTAVETLRQAALVADATALRHRVVAQQRLEILRKALGIARTVEAPARALEREVASLSDGIDATIASIATPPPTLSVAATAVRAGLAELRASAADLDATFAAAGETEDRPEAEFVARILAVRDQVDRREAAVRGFVLPSLVGLRDAAATTCGAELRDLVGDQFARVEETVAVISSMLAAVRRASAIVRDLPLDEEAPMAA